LVQSTIRQGEESDLTSLYSVDRTAGVEPERKILIREAVLDKRCWVVEVGEEFVGYGIISHGFFGRSFLELIYINEPNRSNGYGPRLITFLEAHAKSPDVFTSTNESNSHMQYLLEKLGYERTGVINNLDPGDPEIVYFKRVE